MLQEYVITIISLVPIKAQEQELPIFEVSGHSNIWLDQTITKQNKRYYFYSYFHVKKEWTTGN